MTKLEEKLIKIGYYLCNKLDACRYCKRVGLNIYKISLNKECNKMRRMFCYVETQVMVQSEEDFKYIKNGLDGLNYDMEILEKYEE